jgi:hypothetical protein
MSGVSRWPAVDHENNQTMAMELPPGTAYGRIVHPGHLVTLGAFTKGAMPNFG